jgi:hypothetical protein
MKNRRSGDPRKRKAPGIAPNVVPALNYRAYKPPRPMNMAEQIQHITANPVCDHRGGPYVCTLPQFHQAKGFERHQAGAGEQHIAAEWEG